MPLPRLAHKRRSGLKSQAAACRWTVPARRGPVTTYTATFPPGVGTGALVEAGIFNDPAVGTMLSRVVYPVVNKGAADTMSVTWTVTVT